MSRTYKDALTIRVARQAADTFGRDAVVMMTRRRRYDRIEYVPSENSERAEELARVAWRYGRIATSMEMESES